MFLRQWARLGGESGRGRFLAQGVGVGAGDARHVAMHQDRITAAQVLHNDHGHAGLQGDGRAGRNQHRRAIPFHYDLFVHCNGQLTLSPRENKSILQPDVNMRCETKFFPLGE